MDRPTLKNSLVSSFGQVELVQPCAFDVIAQFQLLNKHPEQNQNVHPRDVPVVTWRWMLVLRDSRSVTFNCCNKPTALYSCLAFYKNIAPPSTCGTNIIVFYCGIYFSLAWLLVFPFQVLHSQISSIEKQATTATGCPLLIRCKNFQNIQFVLPQERDCHDVYISLIRLARPGTEWAFGWYTEKLACS